MDPRFWINRKSLDFLILSAFRQVTPMENAPIDWRKSPSRYDYLVRISGAKRLRPFERRRRKTFLPPGVLIRARKPWQRFRLILLGWYVRFISTPQNCTILVYRNVSLSDIEGTVNRNREQSKIRDFEFYLMNPDDLTMRRLAHRYPSSLKFLQCDCWNTS